MATADGKMKGISNDLQAYLAPNNVSVFDHLTEVLTNVVLHKNEKPVENFYKISREVLENSLRWTDTPSTVKFDLSAQAAGHNLFKVRQAEADPVSAVAQTKPTGTDAYIPDIMAETEMLGWSGLSVGSVNACRIMLSIRQLAREHPELKSVRFFGKILGKSNDYYVCEGEVTQCDERPPKGLKPNHPAKRDLEKCAQHNRFKYYVCHSPGAPWVALPNLRYNQLLAVPGIKRLFSGNLDEPMATFPPSFCQTEANFLRAKIAHIAERTIMSPAGFFTEHPAEPEAGRPQHSIIPVGDWAAPEDLSGYHSEAWPVASWARHYPPVPDMDAFPEDFGPDEAGVWPEIDPEPWPIRPCDPEADGHAWMARTCAVQYVKNAPVCLLSREYPGAVVVFQGKRFVNFYMGFGNLENEKMFTPMFYEGCVMPPVVKDEKYKVFRPPKIERDEEGKITATIPAEIPPAYPKENWVHYNDEAMDLRDKMYVEWEILKKKEEEAAKAAAEAAAAAAAEAKEGE